jgi:hypothetical protein
MTRWEAYGVPWVTLGSLTEPRVHHYRTVWILIPMLAFAFLIGDVVIGFWSLLDDRAHAFLFVAEGAIPVMLWPFAFFGGVWLERTFVRMWLKERIVVTGGKLEWYGPDGRLEVRADLSHLKPEVAGNFLAPWDTLPVKAGGSTIPVRPGLSDRRRLIRQLRQAIGEPHTDVSHDL